MAVLYQRLFLSSVRCFTHLPPTISPQSFTFSHFSSLSSSSSFPSAPALNVISEFLTKECGFSSSQVTAVMRRKPALLRTKSDHSAREAFHFLKDSGFTENQLKSNILRNPTILSLNVNRQLKPKMEFLKNLGLAPEDLRVMISREPRLLGMSLENSLAPKTLLLETLFGSKDYLCKALRRTPKLLSSDFKKRLVPKVEYVKNNLGILEGSAAFARALKVITRVSLEALEEKTKNLASLGLAEEEIRRILQVSPQVLESSTKKIKENMDFLIHTAGLTPEIIASRPTVLNFSLEKTLKPRYELFKYLRTNPHYKCLPSLITFLTLCVKVYLKKFGQYSPQVKSNDHTIS